MAGWENGNQWWKQRSIHGREKLFSTPEILWGECKKYFELTDQRVWIKKDWVGKDAIPVERESSPPYTLTGLYLYLGIDHKTWVEYEKRADFTPITDKVRQIIYTQKFEGASVGAFNANIIARDLGLKEKTENEVTVTNPLAIEIPKEDTAEGEK